MLKIYIPAYHIFQCLADGCPENCCEVFRILFFNWEKERFGSLAQWQDIDGKGTPLTRYVVDDGQECCLGKNEHGCCPFFTDGKLCGLQLRFGQEALPSVCRTFPRLITKLPDRTEYALDTCCVHVLQLVRDWTPGDFEYVDGDVPSDDEFLTRKRAMTLLSDCSLDIDSVLAQIGSLYDFQWRHRSFHFNALQLDFLRKAIAATIWAYAIPYCGHHNHPKSMIAIMAFFSGYLDHLDCSGISGWDELSVDFSRGLSDFVKREKFDDEIEGRYVDSLQD